MRKFYVLCQISVHSQIKTYLPVIARDAKQAIKNARGTGLVPYGVIHAK
jgi:hypothetical protein